MKISQWYFVDLAMLVGAVFFASGTPPRPTAAAAAPLLDFVWSDVCVRGSSTKVAGVVCWGVSVVEFAVVGMASFDLV